MAMTRCEECGKDISTQAKTCPNCGAAKPAKQNKGCLWVAIAIIAFVAIINLLGNKDTTTTSSAPVRWSDQDNRTEAALFLEDRVRALLKAPSTAKFAEGWPNMIPKEHVQRLGAGYYKVRSYVDSQNSFGASIRTHFTADVKQVDVNRWEVRTLNIEK